MNERAVAEYILTLPYDEARAAEALVGLLRSRERGAPAAEVPLSIRDPERVPIIMAELERLSGVSLQRGGKFYARRA